MTGGRIINLAALIILLAAGVGGSHLVLAQTAEEVDALEEQINARKAAIDDINRKLEAYREKIKTYSQQSASLANDVALIENQAAMAELDIAATQNEIESQNLQIQQLEQRISEATQRLEEQRDMMSAMLFELQTQESRGVLGSILGAETFYEAFDTIAKLEDVNDNLSRALDATKQDRNNLEADKGEHEGKLNTLFDLQAQLEQRVAKLDHQRTAKEVLVQQTASSEAEYRTLMSELRQEQQYISSQISALQNQIENRLAESDIEGDASVLSWPLTGIITATFHDPTYPYRHLFQHSGLDIAVREGTPVEAAAGGVVAWARTGTSYGNYVMIIHADGMATLYAHLSRIDVAQDQFVARGQQIGLSGNTGLSTGPHLHF